MTARGMKRYDVPEAERVSLAGLRAQRLIDGGQYRRGEAVTSAAREFCLLEREVEAEMMEVADVRQAA